MSDKLQFVVVYIQSLEFIEVVDTATRQTKVYRT